MTNYWMIEGVGVAVDKVYPHLDNEKVARLLHEQFPENEEIAVIVNSGRCGDLNLNPCVYSDSGVNLTDFLYGNGFDGGLGDLLCHCDDTDSLTFCDNGEGYEYTRTVVVWAEDRLEAEKVTADLCAVGEIELNANDYTDRETICQGVASAEEIKNLGITNENTKEEAV